MLLKSNIRLKTEIRWAYVNLNNNFEKSKIDWDKMKRQFKQKLTKILLIEELDYTKKQLQKLETKNKLDKIIFNPKFYTASFVEMREYL